MNASTTNLQVLLEGVKQFVIPLFQRPYTWGNKNEWKVLWDDIIELYESENPKNHFIGSIVNLPQTSIPEGVAKYSVIDGQQRLTTLIVILLIIRDKYREKNESRLADMVNEYLLINKYQDNCDYYKLLPTQKFNDRESFFSIVNSKKSNDNNQIIKAYIFFEKKIRLTKNIDLQKLSKIITTNLSLVSITLDPNDNPYLVFESLNAKGTPLNASDLIRNYLFMRIHIDMQVEYFNMYWDPMESNLGDNLTEFIRHFLMKDGSIVNKSEVYFNLKNKITAENAIEYLKSLSKYSTYYEKLLSPEKEQNSAISMRLRRLNRIEVTTSYPMLLNFYVAYETNIITNEQFAQSLELLENYLIRRFVSRKPTRELNKIFPSIIKNLHFNDSIIDNFKNLLASKAYPKDYEFEQGFSALKFYGGGDLLAKTRLILETIEESYGHKEKTLSDKLSIEHIMPQSLTDDWKEELGDNYEEIHEVFLHTIGNLTLTGYNPELSNKPFGFKKNLLRDSHLEINKYFSDVDVWNKESIENRTKHLFDICNKIWNFFGSDNIFVEREEVKYTYPVRLVIFDEEFEVKTWRDVLEKTCEFLIENYPEFMNIVDNEFPYYFSKNKESIKDNRQLTNGLFVHVGLSAKSILSVCSRLMDKVNIEQDNWNVEQNAY